MGKKLLPKSEIFSDHCKNFTKFLDFASGKYSRWTVFNDFLAIAAISISNNSDPYNIATNEKIKAEREKRYLEIINKYDKREQRFIMSMFTELVLELDSNFTGKSPHLVDVLGKLFHELNFNDQWKGQFFTPQHICDMTGKMVLSDNALVEKQVKERGYFTACEPCCGAGAMIYGLMNAMYEIGLNPNKNVLVVAGDIDERCILMTYIQCSLYGIPAIIQQKNALTDEALSDAWYTPLYVMYAWRWKKG